jgi:hypothetical protein
VTSWSPEANRLAHRTPIGIADVELTHDAAERAWRWRATVRGHLQPPEIRGQESSYEEARAQAMAAAARLVGVLAWELRDHRRGTPPPTDDELRGGGL